MGTRYGVAGLPTFQLLDAQGVVLDRWTGFADARGFLTDFESALTDLTTVKDKERRHAERPTVELARALTRIRASEGNTDEALRLCRQAQALAGSPRPDLALTLFELQVHRLYAATGSVEEVRAAADAAMNALTGDDYGRAWVALSMAELAEVRKDAALFAPYAEPGLQAARRLAAPEHVAVLPELRLAEALLLRHDENAAFSIKRDAMPAGWDRDPDKMNEFAWWCFENRVRLADAEPIARRAAELAQTPKLKAEILDTVAEIANARGRAPEAAALSSEAAKLDPETEHYRKQVERFSTPSGAAAATSS